MQRHLPSERGWGMLGDVPLRAWGTLPEAWGPCICVFRHHTALSPHPRLGPSASKEKVQFENLLSKEGNICGRGNGVWGQILCVGGVGGGDGGEAGTERGFGSCFSLLNF